MSDLYAILGIAKDAPERAIRAAYRKLAKQHHPDAGGDAAVFQAINLANRVLTDPDRRKLYDERGEIDEASIDAERSNLLQGLAAFGRIVLARETPDSLAYCNVVAAMAQEIEAKIREGEEALKQHQISIDKLAVVQKRLKLKAKVKNRDDALIGILASQRVEVDRVMAGNREVIGRLRKLTEFLKDYEYEVAARPRMLDAGYAQRVMGFGFGGVSS